MRVGGRACDGREGGRKGRERVCDRKGRREYVIGEGGRGGM